MNNSQTQALVIILVIIFSGFVLPEIFEISRLKKNKNDWKNRKDSFKLSTKCQQDDSQWVDCSEFNAETIGNDGCSCSCSKDSATFVFHNRTPTCVGNSKVRDLLTTECDHVAYFNNENMEEPLRLLRTGEQRTLSIPHDENQCKTNLGTSWYIGCNNTTHSLSANNVFTLLEKNSRYKLKVGQVIDANLMGGIINLKINCTSSSTTEQCLLFKLEGTITCALEEQMLLKSFSFNPATVMLSIGKPSPEVVPFSLSTTATILPVGTTDIHPTSIVVPQAHFSTPANPIMQEQSLVASQPSVGSNQEQQQSDNTSPSLGLIVGVSVTLPFVFLLLAGLLIYRRRKSSGKCHKSTSSQKDTKGTSMSMNPQVNSGFKSDEQTGYVTLGCKDSTCVSTCDVPNEKNSSCEVNNSLSHLYVSLENPGQSLGSRSAAQEPVGRGVHGHHRTSSNERLVEATSLYTALNTRDDLHIYGPLSADDAVYNVLEECVADQNEPLYNELETSPPDTQEGVCNDDPVYNVLECSESGEPCFGASSGGEDPVYNVLEGPDLNDPDDPRSKVPDTMEEEPVYSVLDEPNTIDSDSQPEYAVVIRKDLRNKGGVLAEQS